jgi:thiol-disulfide isomerase/thioredoxin
MTQPSRLLAVLACALMVTCGCAQAPSVGGRLAQPSPNETSVGGHDGSAGRNERALAVQKHQAGIADCPTSDANVAVVKGGLPDVVLDCLGGGRSVRLAGLRGRPLMINVWAQWCPPCRAEAPFISEVAADNRTAMVILGVDFVDPLPDKAIEFARISGWRYPQLTDPDKMLSAPLQITGPPWTIFVRADGTVAYRQSGGFTSAGQIRSVARKHLGVKL